MRRRAQRSRDHALGESCPSVRSSRLRPTAQHTCAFIHAHTHAHTHSTQAPIDSQHDSMRGISRRYVNLAHTRARASTRAQRFAQHGRRRKKTRRRSAWTPAKKNTQVLAERAKQHREAVVERKRVQEESRLQARNRPRAPSCAPCAKKQRVTQETQNTHPSIV